MSRSIHRIAAAMAGLIFLAAGVSKALDPAGFAVDIQNYRLLPWTGGVALALYLPWVEILCGGALVLRVAYRGALCIATLMLTAFLVAYGSTRARGLDVACGCFGHGVHHGWSVFIGDPILLGVVIWLLKSDLRPRSPIIRDSSVS